MSLWQGVKGAQVELAAIQHPLQKLRRLGSISKIFAAEILGTIALAPFAFRASSLYNSLPSLDSYRHAQQDPVYVAKDIKYAPAPRSTVDLYLPLEAAAAVQQETQEQHLGPRKVPVVIFVHGGVWAAGDKWHYAPFASCLARLGVLTCVVSYTLYPDALVPHMVAEVSAAFDWAVENVGRYGGDCQQISLVGHSAGAQLCMMALLQRAKSIHQHQHRIQSPQSQHNTGQQQQQQHQQQPWRQQQQQQQLPVMPKQFVAVTGVYDIARHYVYEQERGVHELSTMKRAMGGFKGFAAMSPAVILGAALQQQQQQQRIQGDHPLQQQQQHTAARRAGQLQYGAVDTLRGGTQPGGTQEIEQQQQQQVPPACDFFNSFQLSGEAIAHRIGFDRGGSHYAAAESALQIQSEAGMNPVMEFPLPAAAHLPPTVLVSSCTDVTVPWYESAEMYHKLLDAGVPVKHLVYNKVGHGDFVVDWPTSFSAANECADVDWGQTAAASGQPEQQPAAGTVHPPTAYGSNNNCQPADYLPYDSMEAGGDDDGWAGNGRKGGNNISNTNNTGPDASLLQRRGRRQLLEGLPHYCRDLAIVVMGQQPIHFTTQQPIRGQATSTEAARLRSGVVGGSNEESAGVGSIRLGLNNAAEGDRQYDDEGHVDDGDSTGNAGPGVDAQMVVQLADCDLN